MTETSQPNIPAPAPAPAPVGRPLQLDLSGNKILGALVVAVMAALGGGGVSFAAQPSEAIKAQTEALNTFKTEIKSDLKELESSVDTVAVTIIEVKGKLDATQKNQAKIEEQLKDHEKRIRELESGR